VKDGSNQHILVVNVSFVRKHICQRDWMVDVGRCITVFTPLIAVFIGSESHCLNDIVQKGPLYDE
jgi:hypothetical protein